MTNSQAKASREWEKKNKERANYLRYRSTAKSFILKHATSEDIQAMEQYINQRKELLKELEEDENAL